jgi:hypothetical protein
MTNKDIYSTKFYQDRAKIIKDAEFERTNNIKRPSTERFYLDKTVSILVSRTVLEATLKSTRAEVSQNLDYGLPSDDGIITAKPLDKELYLEQIQTISDCTNKIAAIDKAVLALSDMGDCPFYSDIVEDIHTVNAQLRVVNHQIENYTSRTDKTDPVTKIAINNLSKEKASLDNTLKIKLSTKEELDKILSTIEVD